MDISENINTELSKKREMITKLERINSAIQCNRNNMASFDLSILINQLKDEISLLEYNLYNK